MYILLPFGPLPFKHHSVFKEYQKFKQFTDNLLNRSGKITELIQSLENELVEAQKSETSPEAKRVNKPPSLQPFAWKKTWQFSTPLSYSHHNSPHAPQHPRLVENLEAASTILEKEFEKCELVKVETSGASQPNVDDRQAAEYLDLCSFIFRHDDERL